MGRVTLIVALGVLLAGGANAHAEQLKNPQGRIVWVPDDEVTSALSRGYVRVSNAEASEILTKRNDEPTDWYTPIAIGIGGALAIGLTWVVTKRRKLGE